MLRCSQNIRFNPKGLEALKYDFIDILYCLTLYEHVMADDELGFSGGELFRGSTFTHLC